MTTEERNIHAKNYILTKLETVSKLNESAFTHLSLYNELSQILNNLINVSSKGFRGIVATAITGKFLDPNYTPLTNFYGCNPRSIFEQGIYYAFQNKIPCGKSDPLNVAKNVNVLDENWANGKRPQSAAMAAIEYLRILESSAYSEEIINFFFYRLLSYSETVASVEISIPETSNNSLLTTAQKLSQFVLEYPESGTIPQIVISKILSTMYMFSNRNVEGGDESVFGTNTTSKKPADIWISENNVPIILYEITVKKIDHKRLDDCIDSLNNLNLLDKPVIFICRFDLDTEGLPIQNNSLNYRGKSFGFIDITSFILSSFSHLDIDQSNSIIHSLRDFVSLINRPIKTKEGWNKYF